MTRRRGPYATTGVLTGAVLLDGEEAHDIGYSRKRIGDGTTPGGHLQARLSDVTAVAADVAAISEDMEGKASTVSVAALDDQVVALGDQVGALALGQVTGAVVFVDKAALDAELDYPADTKAEVYADGTLANNGVYRKIGASGAGSWSKISDLATTLQAARLTALDGTVAQAVQDAPVLDYSTIASPWPATIINRGFRTSTFTGWGVVYDTPEDFSTNAIALLEIPRGVVADNARWRRIRAMLLTHATEPLGGSGELLAECWFVVPPDQNPLMGLIGAWMEPGTRTPVEITEADCANRIAVCYQAFSGLTGVEHAVCGEALATRGGGLTPVASYYITTPDGATDAWDGPQSPTINDFGFDLLQLEDLTVTQAVGPTQAFAQRLGLPTEEVSRPGPFEPILTPRLFGLQGYDAVLNFGGMRSGQGPAAFRLDGGVGAGQAEATRWRYPAPQGVTLNNSAMTIEVLDPDYLTVRGQGGLQVKMPAIGSAAAAAKTVLEIGDSMTAAGHRTAEVLDLCAGNALGVQITFKGTLGAGANKHEGRPGWTVDDYFQTWKRTDGGVERTNPFVSGPGEKFNAASYLTNTGQTAPHAVSWLLLTNDVYAARSDIDVHLIMTDRLDKLDRMIGRTEDAAVGSWKEVSASIAHLIGVPIPPAASVDAWGAVYKLGGQTQARFKRNIAIAAWRLIQHYRNASADKCHLVPYHLAIDPVTGFDATDGLHPNVTGYGQMGAQEYFALNVLVSEGVF